MKRKFFTIVLVMALIASNNFAFSAILRVNNNTGVTGTGVYPTISAAYAAASAGDTLLIEGSNTNYGDLTIAKKMVIFGTGYLLTNNANTQSSLITSKLGNLTYSSGADGSSILGCTINSIIINENNITIARNYISNSTSSSASINLNGNNTNIMIKQNLIYGLINNTANKTPSVVIKNNLIGRIVFTESISSALIMNNTIHCSYLISLQSSDNGVDVCNSTVTNNIIWYGTWSNYYGTYYPGQIKFDATQNNTITYNYLNQAAPGGYNGTNNMFSQTHPFAVGSPVGTVDNNFTILAGSAAEAAGQDGTDCGMFGGSDPYILSGMPPIPHIYKLETDPAGTNTDPLNVKISVKAQN